MPIAFDIDRRHNLVFEAHAGRVTLEEYARRTTGIVSHPDYYPGIRFLSDLTAMTGFENDPVGLMALQARLAEVLAPVTQDIFSVVIAPHPVAQKALGMIRGSWERQRIPVVYRLVADADMAADLLALPPALVHDRLDALHRRLTPPAEEGEDRLPRTG